MRPIKGMVWTCALGLAALIPANAGAAWNNVFQVCCNSCGHSSSSYYSGYYGSYYGDACCDPCPQTCCTTRYVQRCYYQPVTCYQTRSYYEPVTTYRTSYYYEPVTSYRYSSYYDPCTGCCQQVACPQTCYRLRAQCCPVQSWVQRCCQVPVTSYRQCSYWEPVTTCSAPSACCAPSSCCAAPCSAEVAAPGYSAPAASATPPYTSPGVAEQRNGPPAGVREYSDQGAPLNPDRRYYPNTDPNAPPTMPGAEPQKYRQPQPRSTPQPIRPPNVKLDRMVSTPASYVQGQLVRRDNQPQSGARLMFVSAAKNGPRQTVTTDATGKFQVSLASGAWLLYEYGADNRPVFHSKIEMRDRDNERVTIVSR